MKQMHTDVVLISLIWGICGLVKTHAESADIRRKNSWIIHDNWCLNIKHELPWICHKFLCLNKHRTGVLDYSDYSEETTIILIRKIKTKSMFKKLTQKAQIYAENNFRYFFYFRVTLKSFVLRETKFVDHSR